MQFRLTCHFSTDISTRCEQLSNLSLKSYARCYVWILIVLKTLKYPKEKDNRSNITQQIKLAINPSPNVNYIINSCRVKSRIILLL
jgi:hypothetical protein